MPPENRRGVSKGAGVVPPPCRSCLRADCAAIPGSTPGGSVCSSMDSKLPPRGDAPKSTPSGPACSPWGSAAPEAWASRPFSLGTIWRPCCYNTWTTSDHAAYGLYCAIPGTRAATTSKCSWASCFFIAAS